MARAWKYSGGLLVPLDGGTPITPPPPPTSSMMIGASVNTDSTVASLETKVGTAMQIYRLYDTEIPLSWTASKGSRAGARSVSWSMHPADITGFANGTQDAKFITFLNSIPLGKLVYICGWPECDSKINRGVYTLAQVKAALAHMADVIHSVGNPNLKATVNTTLQPWLNGSWTYTPEDFWQGGSKLDFYALDKYNPWVPGSGTFKQYSEIIPAAANWFQANSVPWGVSEFGCYEDVTDYSRKATWLKNAADFCAGLGCQYMTYWDNAFASDPDKSLRRLASSTNSLNAWHDVTIKYGS